MCGKFRIHMALCRLFRTKGLIPFSFNKILIFLQIENMDLTPILRENSHEFFSHNFF